MADGLIVEPAVLQVGTDQMSAALQQAAIGFIRHDDELAEAAPGWIGASQQALGELARHAGSFSIPTTRSRWPKSATT